MTTIVWAVLLLLFADAVLSAARSALVNTRRATLEQRADSDPNRIALVLQLLDNSTRMLITFRFARTLCRFGAVGLVVVAAVPVLLPWLTPLLPASMAALAAALVVTLVVTPLVVVLAEMLPEGLVAMDAATWAVRLAPLVDGVQWWLAPIARPVEWLSNRIDVPFDGRAPQVITAEEVKALVEAGEEEGGIEADQRQLINSILRFNDTWVREVMIPRIDMLALEAGTPLAEALDIVLNAGFSRVPVFDDTVDNVIGLLYAKDLLKVWRDGAVNTPLRDILRVAYFVPETKRLADLLTDMQQRRKHMAIVVDEYGGTAGLATLEDIVEEIIGEVQDEYDFVESFRYARSVDGHYICDGGIDLDDLSELLDTQLDAEDADTLAGLIYEQLGRVPTPGETMTVDGVQLEITKVVGRRIKRVNVYPLPVPAQQDETDDRQ